MSIVNKAPLAVQLDLSSVRTLETTWGYKVF